MKDHSTQTSDKKHFTSRDIQYYLFQNPQNIKSQTALERREMAESVVAFLVDKLKSLIEGEVILLSRIRAKVSDTVDELERIQAFLKVADAKEDGDPQLKVWARQVREVAHEMEDVLDRFRLSYFNDPPCGFYHLLEKLSCFIKTWKACHQTAADIEGLNSKVRNLREGYDRYKLVDQANFTSSGRRPFVEGDALLLEAADLMPSREQPKKELIEFLMNHEPGRKVASVLGMGGLGKTTLVKQVYEDPKVKKRFKVHAWITVSQSISLNQLLRLIIHNIFQVIQKPPAEEVDSMNQNQLQERIKKLLQQTRYLIVLDDLWHTDAWDVISRVLPNNGLGSRVMLTTRNQAVAQASGTQGMVHDLQPLSKEDSQTLLYKKTFQVDSCPPNLKNICDCILTKCGGLPLAIVAIGAVLGAKDVRIIDEWSAVSESIGAEIQQNDRLKNMKELLYLSFSDLPYQLKSCFLYLSIFPDLYNIERMRLIRLWLAEGFVITMKGKTPEEVAESYLKELLDRCLIQAAETATDGRVKSYRIHNVIREIVISKSEEQNFSAIRKEEDTAWPEKVRRLSIVNSVQNVPEKRTVSALRSLLIFGAEGSLTNFSIPQLFPEGLQLLTVLDLQGAHLEVFPKEVVKLVLLKFLSLRGSKVKQIPTSIKNLRYLQTLDLKHSHVVELPAEILNLKQLRHLLVYRYEVESYARFNSKYGVKVPAGICGLKSLQKLCKVEANQDNGSLMANLKSLTQLRRLGILKLRKEDGQALCLSIQQMKSLRALSVSSAEKEVTIDLGHISCAPEFLQRLYLTGRLENLPRWISSLQNLVRLFLKWSRLKDDPLVHLQGLPNLVHLELLQVYDGESLHFNAGGFPSLKLLGIDKLDELQLVTIEDGAMPCLEKLIIQRCKLLKKVPSGIELLTSLKSLEFFDMPDELITALYQDGEDQSKVAHVPAVYYSYLKGRNWEVYSLVNDGEGNSQGIPAIRKAEPNILWKV